MSGIYNFSNIRYAAPPLGDLRFRAPVPPEEDRSQTLIALPLVRSQLEGGFQVNESVSSPYDLFPPDPRITEDSLSRCSCSKKIFDRRGEKRAPVLVWIYGGGYVSGDKSETDASGLMQQSMQDGRDGIVYVALNYRLGAFGWLGGETFKKNGTANAGLLDQRLALEWLQKYIHLFEGDPDNVTVMGESAGGGCIFHQLTAYGGQKGPAPFKQAILQSPGWIPVDENQQETACKDSWTVWASTRLRKRGSYTRTRRLLLKGDFDHNVTVMVGHNTNEGLWFTLPLALIESYYSSYLKSAFPELRPSRASLTIADVAFQCNTDYLNRAYLNQTYAYQFSVWPALRGQDMLHTFFNGDANRFMNLMSVNETVAQAMQDYITSFVETGVPKSSLGLEFEKHGEQNRMLELGNEGIYVTSDPTANARCRCWQTGEYYDD
ncbi:hypothetical protein VTN00DRAFT_10085 [Thermoascus crustaceus]|uniref:uncharacterized protein n=1 Tax=Thermoascus crustaceus TaxID=5088 RepID=UPI0037423565